MANQQAPLTPADIDAARKKVQDLALQVAATEDVVARVFDRLAETRGDEDGHRRRMAAEARTAAEKERERAAGSGPDLGK